MSGINALNNIVAGWENRNLASFVTKINPRRKCFVTQMTREMSV